MYFIWTKQKQIKAEVVVRLRRGGRFGSQVSGSKMEPGKPEFDDQNILNCAIRLDPMSCKNKLIRKENQ